MKRYLIDILGNEWSGSGDNKIYEVVKDNNYYSDSVDEARIRRVVTSWFEEYKLSTNEIRRVASPSNEDKLILSIIYVDILTVSQSRGNNFDIEHIATKNKMKNLLESISTSEISYTLPISSIGNICLLPEFSNRRKKDKTLYEDQSYKNEVGKHELTLDMIERDYSFTVKEDLDWINIKYENIDELKKNYYRFIDKRIKIMIDKLVDSLFKNPYRS